MEPEFREIQISKLPRQMVQDIREKIRLYSVAMLIHDDDDSMVIPCSGTLCRFGEKYGVLTARHVWDHRISGIMNHKRLKIVLGKSVYTLEKDWLSPLFPKIEGKESGCDIPDIAFICVPSNISQTFESFTKLFYPIDTTIEKNRANIFDSKGLWFTFGSPKERMNIEQGSVASTTYVTDLKKTTAYDRWDYLYLNVVADKGEMPEDVSGMSGGGIWKAVFSMREDLMEFKLHAVLLSGVNFYQTEIATRYQILGHGPKSIYEALLNVIN